MGFNKDFLWGAASASAQIEGGWNEGGRTPSIWDVAPTKKIKHGDDSHVGCDHYHHMKEDVALMKEMGFRSYRFSLSWSRIIPEEGKANSEGIKFYSDLIDELLANNIEPLVTIFHWDLPLWVYKKGGWLSRSIVELFVNYTRVVVEAFSDRVTYWMPMNEPQCFIMNGYTQGAHAPFKHKYLAIAKLSKNCMLAFSESVKVIRANAKKTPKVGVAMASGAFVPDSDNKADVEKAREMTFYSGAGLMSNRWWCDPMLLGKGVRAYGVYNISDKFAKEICQPLDFLGLNLYAPYNDADWGGDGKKPPSGRPRSSIGWTVDERVLYYAPKFMYERYRLPIMITENGLSDNDWVSLDGKVHDAARTDFLYRYLGKLKRVVDDGVPVIGYQHWSVMDNFEWAEGYEPRFGLIHVNYQSGKRTLKDSSYEYKKIIEANGKNV
jgi:beta-glucosidase